MIDEQPTIKMSLERQGLGARFGGLELAYAHWGSHDASRTIVCVHGLTRNARDFDPLAAALAGKGARVIAVDMAGRGHSGWSPDPEDYAVPVYVDQMAALLQELGVTRTDWIGTSMGGLIGMGLASRDGSSVERLVLNDIGPFIPAAALQAIAAYLSLELRFHSMDELEAHLRLIHASFGTLTDAQWAHLATHSARADGDGFRLHYDPAIAVPFARSAGADVELWDLWAKVTCPCLMIRGQHSTLLLEPVLRRAALRPGTDTVEFTGCGHAPALMDAHQIATITAWLGL